MLSTSHLCHGPPGALAVSTLPCNGSREKGVKKEKEA